MVDASEITAGEERVGAEQWARVIEEQGYGYLFGDFKGGWLIRGRPVSEIKPEGMWQGLGGYDSIGHFGRDDNLSMLSNDSPIRLSTRHFSRISGHGLTSGETNYFAVYQLRPTVKREKKRFFKTKTIDVPGPDADLVDGLGLQGDWSAATYHMTGRTDFAGRATLLSFSFVLPTSEINRLTEEVVKNPDLIEEIFQLIYPKLSGDKGVKRAKAKKLMVYSFTNVRSRWKVDGVEKVDHNEEFELLAEPEFSTPVGERSVSD